MEHKKIKDPVELNIAEDEIEEHRSFYTVEEISNLLKVSPETVRRFIRTGKLKAIKVGFRALRIEKSHYETFLDQFYN